MWEKERVQDRAERDPLWKEIAKLRRLGGDERMSIPRNCCGLVDALLGDYHLQPDRYRQLRFSLARKYGV